MAVLSAIGRILLILFLIVLALVLCLIALPVVYRVKAVYHDSFHARGTVRWLFGFLYFSFEFENRTFTWQLRLAGIPLHKILGRKKEEATDRADFDGSSRKNSTSKKGSTAGQKASGSGTIQERPAATNTSGKGSLRGDHAPEASSQNGSANKSPAPGSVTRAKKQDEPDPFGKTGNTGDTQKRAKKQPTIKPGQRTSFVTREETAKQEAEPEWIDRENRRYFRDESVFAETSEPEFADKIKFTFQKISDTIKWISEGFGTFRAIWPDVKKLLLHIRPRKLEGEIGYGFDDPAKTGQLLALISMIYPALPEKLKVTPDFSEKHFDCDLAAGGHLFLVYGMVSIIKIFKTPELKKMLSRGRQTRRQTNG